MGNSSSKDSRNGPRPSHSRAAHDRPVPAQSSQPSTQPAAPEQRLVSEVYETRTPRGSRHDISLFSLGRDRDAANAAPERPRETKQEREARKAEKERQARLKERERSMKEEGVDGGYLVTLGTYTGPEDFSKSIVRQLQVSR